MEEERRPGASTRGYLVVLLGALGFVGALFIPFYDTGNVPVTMGDPSLFRIFTSYRESGLESAGGVLRLFAGIATIAWIALVGLRTDRSWAPAALLAVSVAESLAWIGTILGGWEIFSPHRIGYWAIIVSVIVVFAGAVTVWLSARTSVSEQQQPTTV